MASGRESLIEFIEQYRELECLWKVTDKDYKNKTKRLTATEKLLQILKKTDASANMDTATKKINSLRSSFNKEHNKVKSSYRSGAGADDVHVPKLWYYDLLLFLADRDTELRKPSDVATVLNSSTAENEDIGDLVEMEPPSPCSSHNSTITNVSNNSQSSSYSSIHSKRKIKNTAAEVLSKISNRLDSQKPKQKYNSYGEHVAEKLRSMPEAMASYCQKIINDAIFYADCGKLNYSSRIVTDYQREHFQMTQAQLLSAQPPQIQLPSTQMSPAQLQQTQHRSPRSPQIQLPPAQLQQNKHVQLLQDQPPQVQMPYQSSDVYNDTLSYESTMPSTKDDEHDEDDVLLSSYIEALRK